MGGIGMGCFFVIPLLFCPSWIVEGGISDGQLLTTTGYLPTARPHPSPTALNCLQFSSHLEGEGFWARLLLLTFYLRKSKSDRLYKCDKCLVIFASQQPTDSKFLPSGQKERSTHQPRATADLSNAPHPLPNRPKTFLSRVSRRLFVVLSPSPHSKTCRALCAKPG